MSVRVAKTDQPLSVALKEGSAVEHARAEQSPFVTELLAGRVNNRGYVDYLLRLRVVYGALEDAVRASRHDRLEWSPLRPLMLEVYPPSRPTAATHQRRQRDRVTHRRGLPRSHRRGLLGRRAWWPTTTPAISATCPAAKPSRNILDRTFALRGAGLAMVPLPCAPSLSKIGTGLDSTRCASIPTRFVVPSTKSRSRSRPQPGHVRRTVGQPTGLSALTALPSLGAKA